MPQTVSQCTNCGAFTRRSFYHEEEYQGSVLLERLRTTNFPATDEEISHVRHTILPTVSNDIFSIDSKVASLREVITAMVEERGRLKIVQTKYNNLVSLHRGLPSELWSEIFLYTLSTPSDSNAFDASGPIWQLSHVCQKWRNIALSLHSFWSTIYIYFPKAGLRQEADMQRLEAVIQRSRQGPLNLGLLSDELSLSDRHNPDSNLSTQRRLLDILLAESYRWRELHLVDRGGGLNMLYAPLHNRLPRLESVGLQYPYEHSVASVFKNCPRLKKLTLGGASTLGVDFPWDQITELDLSCTDVDGDEEERRACIVLIRRCPSLEILRLPHWDLEDDGDESLYAPTTCSNIRKLDATSVPVINALTLPGLRDAFFRPDPHAARYNALYSFKQLLIRSNCLGVLTNLSLAGVPLVASPFHTLHSLLSQTHSLAFLDLAVTVGDYDDATDASDRVQIFSIVISLEVIPTRPVTFLPLLSSLNIRVYNHRDPRKLQYFGPVGIFASTVKARWEGDDTVGLARLRTCHFAVQARHLEDSIYRVDGSFVNIDIFTEAERLIFNALIDDGMDLAIRVTSDLTANVGGKSVVFAVPS